MYFQEVMIKFGQTLPNFGNLNQRSTGRWVMSKNLIDESLIKGKVLNQYRFQYFLTKIVEFRIKIGLK
jgi:hypothetical protein